jgi:hypothetical protein
MGEHQATPAELECGARRSEAARQAGDSIHCPAAVSTRTRSRSNHNGHGVYISDITQQSAEEPKRIANISSSHDPRSRPVLRRGATHPAAPNTPNHYSGRDVRPPSKAPRSIVEALGCTGQHRFRAGRPPTQYPLGPKRHRFPHDDGPLHLAGPPVSEPTASTPCPRAG